MIVRVLVKCAACANLIVLRITVEGGYQPFIFGCPHCVSEIHGSLDSDTNRPFGLASNDFEQVDEEESGGELAVPVNTGVPVHLSLIGQPAKEALMSPFLHATMNLGDDGASDVMERINAMRGNLESLYPHVRRASSHFRRQDRDNLVKALAQIPGAEKVDFSERDPYKVFGVALSHLFSPLERGDWRVRARDELTEIVQRAFKIDPVAVKKTFDEFAEGPLGRHRVRVIDTVMVLLGDNKALFPALFSEGIELNGNLADFRVMRNDFDVIKGRYQDVFELASRTLAFISRLANIALRADASKYVDGTTRTFNKALNKTTAFNREPWLEDFPAAREMYESMSRRVRNDIGHRLVRYDFETGHLSYEDGRGENYLNFLIGYLDSVRLCHYLVEALELLDHISQLLAKE